MARRQMTRQGQNADGVWQYQAVNRYTGEVIELHGGELRGQGKDTHVRVYQQAMEELACRRVLGEEAWAVLGALLGALDWDNWLVVLQQEIAAKLGMTAPQVSRAIATLKEQGVLLQAPPPAPRSAYRLRADFAYRGSRNGWYRRRREEEDAKQHTGEA